MILGTEFVRRAAANVQHVTSSVTSTVSTVASAASGRRGSTTTRDSNSRYQDNSLIANAKEKYNTTLKCTPNKDAMTTSSLAVKSGYLMKRNEQGNWQKRYLCIVPHMFLYYYDTDMADSPRGIIDLELYTNIMRDEGGKVLKLTTAEEGPLRAFYFDDDDPATLNEWITSFIRDRYHAVVDERNAYQQMQFEMTGAIDQASTLRKMSEKEREELEKQLSQANHLYLDTRAVLQNVLVIMGITEEEMSKLTDVGKIGQRLKISIAKMKEAYERKIEEVSEMMEEQNVEHHRQLQEAERRIEQEQQGRRNLEAVIIKDRREAERRVHDIETQIETVNMNFQMAVAGKMSMESKNSTLLEQKKLLVTEVKKLRRKVDDSASNMEDLKALNDKLSAAALALQQQLRDAQEKIDSQAAALAANANGKVRSESMSSESRDSDFTREQVDELLAFNDRMLANLAAGGSASPGEGEKPSSVEEGEDRAHEEHASWDLPQTSMKDMEWISDEQNKLMQQRLAANDGQGVSPAAFRHHAGSPVQTAEAEHAGRRSSMSMLMGMTKAIGMSSEAPTGPHAAPQKRSSMFSSILGGGDDSKSETSSHHSSGSFFSPFSSQSAHAAEPVTPEDRMPSAYRMNCLRCQGTVEGPKYSTCKCATPALVPEDLATSSSGSSMRMFSGLLSKGSNVAGGLAGGLVKATVHGMGSFMGSAEAAAAPTTATAPIVRAVPRFGEATDGEAPIRSTASTDGGSATGDKDSVTDLISDDAGESTVSEATSTVRAEPTEDTADAAVLAPTETPSDDDDATV